MAIEPKLDRLSGAPTSAEEPAAPPVIHQPSFWAVGKELVEFLSKAVPLIVVTLYLGGYLITARHLAGYGVPVTQLLNAQYFVAGVIPAAFFWLTVFVGYSAFRYGSRDTAKHSRIGHAALLLMGLFLLLLFVEIADSLSERFRNQRFLGPDSSFNLYVIIPARGLLGELALWYTIAGWRSGHLRELAKYFRRKTGEMSEMPAYVAFLIGLGLIGVSAAYRAAGQIYTAIPQAYGGGSPLKVQLFVERAKVPPELLATDGEKRDLVYTMPVRLIFQTPSTLVVDLIADSTKRVWSLDSKMVHAVLANLEEPRQRPKR